MTFKHDMPPPGHHRDPDETQEFEASPLVPLEPEEDEHTVKLRRPVEFHLHDVNTAGELLGNVRVFARVAQRAMQHFYGGEIAAYLIIEVVREELLGVRDD
jgi:hypothetical protein